MHRPIYLDHHATTPCAPEVVEAMLPYFTERFGNAASRTHVYGFEAKAAVERAREQVATLIGCSPKEIVFTSGATESDNLAVIGFARANADRGKHIVTTAIEHKAILDSCKYLEQHGWAITVLSPGSDGRVHADQVEAALRDDTVLVSVMMVNNEIGSIQPIAEIAERCRAQGVFVHSDAVQALGRVPVDVGALGVDMLSITAHKMYGPKGIGALYFRRGRPRVRVEALIHGGGHERGLRSGTLAVPQIVGLGAAAELTAELMASGEVERQGALRDRLWKGLAERVEGVRLNGSMEHRVTNNLNIAIPGVEGEALIMGIRHAVACSSGSACSSANLEPSPILRAIGVPSDLAHNSLRFGLGRGTTEEDIDRALDVITAKVAELRDLNPLTGA